MKTTQRTSSAGDYLRSSVAQLVTAAAVVEHGNNLVAVTLPAGTYGTYAVTLPNPLECPGAMVTIKVIAKAALWIDGTVTVEGHELANIGEQVVFLSIGSQWLNMTVLAGLPSRVDELENV